MKKHFEWLERAQEQIMEETKAMTVEEELAYWNRVAEKHREEDAEKAKANLEAPEQPLPLRKAS